MTLAAKITTGVVALVVVGLVALAAPAIATIGQAAHETTRGVSNLAATFEPSAEPVVQPVEPTPEPTPHDDLQAAAWAIGCDDFVSVGGYANAKKPSPRPDRGASEYASGTVTFGEDGGVETYTVAAGDSGMSIGERFCVDYITLEVANQQRWRMGRQLQPGDVLLINP
jgi:hypothetical protein